MLFLYSTIYKKVAPLLDVEMKNCVPVKIDMTPQIIIQTGR